MKSAHLLTSILTASFAAFVLSTASCTSLVRDGKPSSTELPSNIKKTSHADTKEACDACGGIWDIHGIEPVETCICPTKDAGHSCTDGAQCEGMCIVGDDGFQVTEPGETPLGFYVGACSNYDTTFGCNRIVPAGTVEKGAHPATEGFEDICVD